MPEENEKIVEKDIEEKITEEDLDAMNSFDDKIEGDVEDSANDDAEEKDGDEQAEEEDSAEEEKTAEQNDEKASEEDKAIEAEMEAMEKKASGEIAQKQEAEKEPEKEEEAKDEEKYVSDLDPEEWDEEVIELDRKRGQQHLDQLKELKKTNADLMSKVEAQAAQQYTEWLDGQFNSLGDDFKEVIGEGDVDDIEPGSEQFENRGKVVVRMNQIAQAYQNLGKPVPTKKKLFQKALEREFKEIINKPKNQAKTIEKLKKRAGQTIGKGAKGASEISAEEAVRKSMKDFDAKLDR